MVVGGGVGFNTRISRTTCEQWPQKLLWLEQELWGSKGSSTEQLPGMDGEGGTNPPIPDGSLSCWAAGAGFTQALLFMDVSLLLAFCSTLSHLLVVQDVLPCVCSHAGISLKPCSSLEC